jgi:hypothetical protein
MKWLAMTLLLLTVGIGVAVYFVSGHAELSASPASNGNSPDGGARTTTTATPQSRQYTVLLDVSASRPSTMIADSQRYMDTLIDQMNYGDHLVILQMYEAGVKQTKDDFDVSLTKFADSLTLDDKEELKTARNNLKDPVHIFFDRAKTTPVMQTDILSTLSIASEQISDGKRNELIILSDMIQSSKDFEFEHLKRMPSPGWIAERKLLGLVRPLYGTCVVVVGADPSTREGVLVREFWQKYFEASNATLSPRNYRTTPPSGGFSLCE